jgi:hypothetical protein
VGGFDERAVTVERMAGFLDVMTTHGRAPLTLHGDRPARSVATRRGS